MFGGNASAADWTSAINAVMESGSCKSPTPLHSVKGVNLEWQMGDVPDERL
jgi:hypothetical protein